MTMQEGVASLCAHKTRFRFITAAIAAVLCLAGTICARAQSPLTVIYQFTNGIDGSGLNATLFLGNDGNLYGTTVEGGTNSPVTAMFKLTLTGSLKVIHTFGTNHNVSLINGVDGNFYGTFFSGDDGETNLTETVFKITPSGAFSRIYSTPVTNSFSVPRISFQGNDGNLYGSTMGGGSYGPGSIFKITPNGKFTVLHSLESSSIMVMTPAVFKVGTNFYGTSQISLGGGPIFFGGESVFAFSSTGAFRTVCDLTNSDDGTIDGMTLGADGKIYGSAILSSNGCGKIFTLTPSGNLTTLYQFTGGADGANPSSLVMRPSDGHFFGLTSPILPSGTNNNTTVFEFIPPSTLYTLYTFTNAIWTSTNSGPILIMPLTVSMNLSAPPSPSTLIVGPDGNLYGIDHASPTNNFVYRLSLHPMLDSEVPLANQVYWTQMASGYPFGYYSLIDFPYVCHFSMGWEYYVDAMDGSGDAYLYDFTSGHWFYTGTDLFPYLYDFSLNTWLYYYPDSKSPGGYTSNPRQFYDFWTDQVITQ